VTSKYVTNILFAAQERGFTEGGKIYFSTTAKEFPVYGSVLEFEQPWQIAQFHH